MSCRLKEDIPECPLEPIGRADFVKMQKIAARGADAIEELLNRKLDNIPEDVNEKDDSVLLLNKFTGNLTSWGQFLGVIGHNA